jgi:hypothetical protein
VGVLLPARWVITTIRPATAFACRWYQWLQRCLRCLFAQLKCLRRTERIKAFSCNEWLNGEEIILSKGEEKFEREAA